MDSEKMDEGVFWSIIDELDYPPGNQNHKNTGGGTSARGISGLSKPKGLPEKQRKILPPYLQYASAILRL